MENVILVFPSYPIGFKVKGKCLSLDVPVEGTLDTHFSECSLNSFNGEQKTAMVAHKTKQPPPILTASLVLLGKTRPKKNGGRAKTTLITFEEASFSSKIMPFLFYWLHSSDNLEEPLTHILGVIELTTQRQLVQGKRDTFWCIYFFNTFIGTLKKRGINYKLWQTG